MANVQLKDQVVKRGPQVVIRLPHEDRPSGVDWFDLADPKAIFVSISMSLLRDGPELVIDPPVEFVFESAVVLDCPTHLGYGAFQASAHGFTRYGLVDGDAQ
jgi:hypothetical protein